MNEKRMAMCFGMLESTILDWREELPEHSAIYKRLLKIEKEYAELANFIGKPLDEEDLLKGAVAQKLYAQALEEAGI